MIATPLHRALLLLPLMTPLPYGGAAEPEPAALPQVVDTLAAAKSKAEDAVHVVKMYATDDAAIQIEAIRDYANARAAFNGLIESLLIERDPDAATSSALYHRELDRAKDAEEILMKFVQQRVVDAQPHGGKAPIGALLNGIGSVFDGLSKLGNSWVAVHQEITREPDVRRTQIHELLTELKWQQFAKIP